MAKHLLFAVLSIIGGLLFANPLTTLDVGIVNRHPLLMAAVLFIMLEVDTVICYYKKTIAGLLPYPVITSIVFMFGLAVVYSGCYSLGLLLFKLDFFMDLFLYNLLIIYWALIMGLLINRIDSLLTKRNR